MSGSVMILLGLVVALSGVWSVRLALATAGAGAAWVLAGAFGASTGTALLVAAAGGLLAFVIGLLASRVIFFAVGVVLGTLIGARLFAILDTGDASLLLAVIFVPAVAFTSGVLAGRWRVRFMGWATAIGGSGLVLAGVGRLTSGDTQILGEPHGYGEQSVALVAWAVLAVLSRLVQRRLTRSRAPATA